MKICVRCGTRLLALAFTGPARGDSRERLSNGPAFVPGRGKASDGRGREYLDELARLEACSCCRSLRSQLMVCAIARNMPAARSLLRLKYGIRFEEWPITAAAMKLGN